MTGSLWCPFSVASWLHSVCISLYRTNNKAISSLSKRNVWHHSSRHMCNLPPQLCCIMQLVYIGLSNVPKLFWTLSACLVGGSIVFSISSHCLFPFFDISFNANCQTLGIPWAATIVVSLTRPSGNIYIVDHTYVLLPCTAPLLNSLWHTVRSWSQALPYICDWHTSQGLVVVYNWRRIGNLHFTSCTTTGSTSSISMR